MHEKITGLFFETDLDFKYTSNFIRYKLFLMGNKKYVIQYIYMTKRIALNYAVRSQKSRQDQQMFITLENIIWFSHYAFITTMPHPYVRTDLDKILYTWTNRLAKTTDATLYRWYISIYLVHQLPSLRLRTHLAIAFASIEDGQLL